MSLIYYPAMTAVLAWVTARYTLVVCGYIEAPLAFLEGTNSTLNSPECITLALFYLILAFFVNTIAPSLAGKFQISSTIVKLVPIAFIAVVGTIIGLVNGNLGANFAIGEMIGSEGGGLFAAICSTVFAYEGWIVATSINSEMKDSKKNLPIALCVGTLIIVAAYTLYNLGILGLANIGDVATGGTSVAFNFFGGAVASIINVLVVISCLGTLNGLMLGGCRGLYSLAARGEGLAPDTFSQVDKKSGIPHNSAIFTLMMCAVWFVYFVLLGAGLFDFGTVSKYAFDSSELPIITLYAFYIPILISMIKKEKELSVFKRFVLPILSLCGIGVIIYASIDKHGMGNVWYLIVFALFMIVGAIAYRKNEK
jgi:APA family basic amino acid/polyamine antiporter